MLPIIHETLDLGNRGMENGASLPHLIFSLFPGIRLHRPRIGHYFIPNVYICLEFFSRAFALAHDGVYPFANYIFIPSVLVARYTSVEIFVTLEGVPNAVLHISENELDAVILLGLESSS